MQAESSDSVIAEALADDGRSPPRPVFADLGGFRAAAIVALAYLPLAHVSLVAALVVVPLVGRSPMWVIALAPVVLYLLPPLVVRIAGRIGPIAPGSYTLDDAAYLRWWHAAQWQVLYNRLPAIEELLRLVPGAYSAWLRLWGSPVGGMVYWSPGVRVLDRQLVAVGRGVVFGVGTRLHGHLVDRSDDGVTRLLIGPVTVGQGALVGGFSLLVAGCSVAPGEVSPALYALPPGQCWRGGRRVRVNYCLLR